LLEVLPGVMIRYLIFLAHPTWDILAAVAALAALAARGRLGLVLGAWVWSVL
jgi:hypothetical protein